MSGPENPFPGKLPIEPRMPKYRSGQPVWAAADLYNDGSHPHAAGDALLVRSGEAGEIVQVGMHEESNTPVYMVEFASRHVVGCLEEEISPEPEAAAG
ncbi:MAG: hypothetical protein Kow0026_19900 [Oricola sp.]